MKITRKKRIRPTAADGTPQRRRGIPFELIANLPENERNRIEIALVKGTPDINTLARQLQSDHNELQEYEHRYIASQISQYKKETITGRLVKLVEGRKKKGQSAVVEFRNYEDRKLDPYYLQEQLISLQQERINKLYARESKLQHTTLDCMRRELQLYQTMIGQLTNLQFDLGIMKRVPKKVQAQMQLHENDAAEDAALQASRNSLEQKNLATHAVFAILEDMSDDDAPDYAQTDNVFEGQAEAIS